MRIQSLLLHFLTAVAGLLLFNAVILGSPQEEMSVKEAIAALQARIDRQDKQIEALMQTVASQQQVIDQHAGDQHEPRRHAAGAVPEPDPPLRSRRAASPAGTHGRACAGRLR